MKHNEIKSNNLDMKNLEMYLRFLEKHWTKFGDVSS